MKAVIHHTGAFATNNRRQLESVNRSHEKRFNFPSKRTKTPTSDAHWYVGYHFFLERIGVFEQTRNLDELGAHTFNERLNKGYNDYIGICLARNFNLQDPSEEQLDDLRRILVHDLKIDRRDVFLHRDLDDTACPGQYLTHDTIDRLYEHSKDISAVRKLLLKGRRYWSIAKDLIYKHQ